MSEAQKIKIYERAKSISSLIYNLPSSSECQDAITYFSIACVMDRSNYDDFIIPHRHIDNIETKKELLRQIADLTDLINSTYGLFTTKLYSARALAVAIITGHKMTYDHIQIRFPDVLKTNISEEE
jgi:hypothetical protein